MHLETVITRWFAGLSLAVLDIQHGAMQTAAMPHFIKIGDGNGHKSKLIEKTLMRLTCTNRECSSRIWIDWREGQSETTIGVPNQCFHCGAPLEKSWGKGQLAFVPESEFALESANTGDLVEIEFAGTDDLPADWTDLTAETRPEHPAHPVDPDKEGQ